MTPEQRVEAGRQADDAAQFLREIAESLGHDAGCHFYRRVGITLHDQLKPAFPVPEPEFKPMTPIEATRFGATRKMLFGRYKGFFIKDVPLVYLEWFADTQAFAEQIRQYLHSEGIKSERRQSEQEEP